MLLKGARACLLMAKPEFHRKRSTDLPGISFYPKTQNTQTSHTTYMYMSDIPANQEFVSL
jgi:hypothetical protein